MWVARNIVVNLSRGRNEVRRKWIRSKLERSMWIEVCRERQHLMRKLEVRVCLAHSGNSKETREAPASGAVEERERVVS